MKGIYVKTILFVLSLSLFFPGVILSQDKPEGNRKYPGEVSPMKAQSLSLPECIEIGLKNNRYRLVSKASRDIAEAQYKQALSAYWPQLKLSMTGTRMDEPTNFIFPAQPLPLGAAAGPFAEAIALAQLAKMGITPSTPGFNTYLEQTTAQVMQELSKAKMPAYDIKLMDRDTLFSSLEMIYPLYTGGKRSSIVAQAKSGIDIAKEGSRQTDLQIINDVKHYYHASVLSKNLLKLGQDTLERFEVTLELTENLYKNGSGKVKKTDYLRNQVVVASIRSAVELLKSNEQLSKAALVNAMGLEWRTLVEPSDNEIPFKPYEGDLEAFVTQAHQLNPQFIQVQHGITATEAKVKEARSGHLPILVFFANMNRIDNSYDAGIVTPENKKSWALGIRMELPIFNGFRTTNEEREAAARVERLRQQKGLLKEGLALQVKDAFLQIARSQGQVKATKDALNAAVENRDLNTRAYNDELVETKDVIEAQLMEFFINGQYLKALYDNVVNQSNLEFIIGRGIIDAS